MNWVSFFDNKVYSVIYDFLDFIKNHPILFVLCIIVLLSPIQISMSEWNTHPKRIICTTTDNTCKMNVYSYKHEICWDWLLQSKHNHRGCKLPKYKSSEINLISLPDIQDVIVKKENKFYKVYLTGKDDNKFYISQFKNEERATYLASNLMTRIKKWQGGTSILDNELENTYSYEFIE